jgi:predicted TIM-barrel fold metal-dependent hydrolase
VVIDADVHATDTRKYPARGRAYYHGRPLSLEEIVEEMDGAEVDKANVWQNPAATIYPGGAEANFAALLGANEYIATGSLKHPGRFIASGWTDPQACGVDLAIRIAELCVRDYGFAIVKMNPAQNRYPIDSEPVMAVVEAIVGLGAIPAFHYGADTPYTPASGLEKILQRFPHTPILAVHMGGGGAGYLDAEKQYHESIALGLRYPNLRYALSALRDTYIEEALLQYQRAGEPFSRNLFCASDAPYGRMAWNFGGFRAMFETLRFDADSVRGYLGGNFARLLEARR